MSCDYPPKKSSSSSSSSSTERTRRQHGSYAVCGTRYTALQLTLSGRSSGAEYTCYQSGHIPNHSTIDRPAITTQSAPFDQSLIFDLAPHGLLARASFVFHILFSLLVAFFSLHPFPPPSFRPHPLPKRQSTCTAALVVDGAVFTSA